MGVYQGIIRPLLFWLSPERAHSLALRALAMEFPWHVLRSYFEVADARLNVDLCGISLRNPVGLAAGFDKDCQALEGLMHLGFGYLVCGSIVRHPHRGRPHPVLWRYPELSSLVNCMGVPSKGLEYSEGRLGEVKRRE